MIDLSGKFITFEGIDGCGKSTQTKAVVEALKTDGHSVVSTREPGGTALGEKIREVLVDPRQVNMNPACELLLYCADRAQHLHEVIEPALERGHCVISDRYYDSTMVYQAVDVSPRSYFRQTIEGFCLSVIQNRIPDLTILISIDPYVAMARMQAVSMFDRFDAKDAEFFGRVHAAYMELVERHIERFFVVDGDQPAEDITMQILDMMRAKFYVEDPKELRSTLRAEAIADGMPLLTEDEVLEKRNRRLSVSP